MHAVYFKSIKFLTPELAQKWLEKAEEMDERYGREDYDRRISEDGLTIFSMTYEPVDWWNFDDMLDRQTTAKDIMFSQPGTYRRKKGRNGYDSPMIDFDEEDDE